MSLYPGTSTILAYQLKVAIERPNGYDEAGNGVYPGNAGLMKPWTVRLNVLALFLISLGWGTFSMYLNDPPLSSWAYHWWGGKALGAGIGLFAISGVIPLICFLIGGLRAAKASAGLLIWWLLWVLVAYLVYYGTTYDRAQASNSSTATKYAPTVCSHFVIFPSSPEIKIISSGGLVFDQAMIVAGNSFLRAECVPLPATAPEPTDEAMISLHHGFAAKEGLQHSEVTSERRADGRYFFARGNKIVGGIPATYRYVTILTRASIMTLVVGGASSHFPTSEMSAFLESASPTSVTVQPDSAEVGAEQTLMLMAALEDKDYAAANLAIQKGANVNFKFAGRPLLVQAVRENDVVAAKLLIQNGASVNSRTGFGRAALHEAALYGHVEIAELLIKAGAEVNARNSRGETPLFYSEVGLVLGPEHTPMHDRVSVLLRKHGGTR